MSLQPLDLDLALQGGGAHGAFTWGVLDRLLQEPTLQPAGISGTSAGALNAVALAAGWQQGRHEGARAALRRLWEGVARIGAWHAWVLPLARQDQPAAAWSQWMQDWWSPVLRHAVSPYQFNPLDLNPLRELLADQIDFERLRQGEGPQLFIATTHVRSGHLRIFRRPALSVDVVLASACLPTLFRAVEIEGEAYWDGGYAGNPSLLPLIMESPADDLLLVQVNPRLCSSVPTTARAIVDRMNEITFNASLLKELRAIGLMKQLCGEEAQAGHPMRSALLRRIHALRVHRVDSGELLSRLGPSSRLDLRWRFLLRLHGLGHAAADDWLCLHRHALGHGSSVDLAAEVQA